MVVVELLHAVGVRDSIATAVAAGPLLKHCLELLGLFPTLGLAARMAGLLRLLVVVVSSGLVLGLDVDVSVSLGVLWGARDGCGRPVGGTGRGGAVSRSVPPVARQRCAFVAANPLGQYLDWCQACGRERV